MLATMHTSLHALSLFIRNKWTRYSTLFTPQYSIHPYLPCSAAIKFLNSNIPYRPYIPYRPSTAHGLHSFCIQPRQTTSAMLSIASTLYIATTHNITHSPCTSTCTPSTTQHTAFHNPLHTTKKNTKHICVSSGKLAQDVGMVWKCYGVIPI